MNPNRIADTFFLEWISQKEWTDDFNTLKGYLHQSFPQINHEQIDRFFVPLSNRISFPRPAKSISKFKFRYSPDHKLNKREFRLILKEIEIPPFFATTIYRQISFSRENAFSIQWDKFLDYNQRILEGNSKAKKLFNILLGSANRSYLLPSDFCQPIYSYICGLNQPDKSYISIPKGIPSQIPKDKIKYFAEYIIIRLFLRFDPELRGAISYKSFATYDFMSVLQEATSYDQFMVTFNIFNSLKANKDSKYLTIQELSSYDSYRINPFVINRILSVLPNYENIVRWQSKQQKKELISYSDFIYFIILFEDKYSIESLNFWFRVCDLDEDGVLSLAEMNTLYSKQIENLPKYLSKISPNSFYPATFDIEPNFDLIVPRILDMIGKTVITKRSLQKSFRWATLFNVLVDTKNYAMLDFEDPPCFTSTIDELKSPWELFCEEYWLANREKRDSYGHYID